MTIRLPFMNFIGREHELSVLEEHYRSEQFEFAAVYGRRRVGKTSLLQEFVRDKPAVFFTAVRASATVNLDRLRRQIAGFTPVAAEAVYLDDILAALLTKARQERVILVIDEYPLLDAAVDGAMGMLQRFIDHEARDSRLFLILCGSSLSFMKRQVLGYSSPLYGRRTCQLEVAPLDYYESARFLPGREPAEMALIYGIVGGIPLYLQLFRSGEIFRTAAREFLTDGFTLGREPEILLLEEMHDPGRYRAVISALAEGRVRVKEIADRAQLTPSEVVKALDDLIDLDYVEKITPAGEKEGRTTRYFFKDNLFQFYYRVISPQADRLCSLSEEAASDWLAAMAPDYMGRVFEEMCGQYLLRLGYSTIGRWWGKGPDGEEREIDVVASRPSLSGREALLAECKYQNAPMLPEALFRLQDAAANIRGFTHLEFILFSRSGFTERLAEQARLTGTRLVTLEELYHLPKTGTVQIDLPDGP